MKSSSQSKLVTFVFIYLSLILFIFRPKENVRYY